MAKGASKRSRGKEAEKIRRKRLQAQQNPIQEESLSHDRHLKPKPWDTGEVNAAWLSLIRAFYPDNIQLVNTTQKIADVDRSKISTYELSHGFPFE